MADRGLWTMFEEERLENSPAAFDNPAWTPPRFLRRHAQRVQRRRRIRRLLVTLGLALFLYAFVFSRGGLMSIARTHLEVRSLEQEVAQLEERQTSLQIQIERRQSDPATIEALARETYGMSRPGEKVFRILEISEAQAQRLERRQQKIDVASIDRKEKGPSEESP